MSLRARRRKEGRFRGVAAEDRLTRRREMLIAAGVEVYGTRGFHSATVRDICREAKLTERYFYESFAKGEDLFVAVYEHLATRLRDTLVAALVPVPREAGPMARSALRGLFQTMKEDPRVMRILFIEVLTVSEDVGRLSRRTTKGFSLLIQGVIEALYPKLRGSGMDLRLISDGLVGAFMNTATQWAYGGYQEPVDSMVTNTAVLFEALGAYAESRTERRAVA